MQLMKRTETCHGEVANLGGWPPLCASTFLNKVNNLSNLKESHAFCLDRFANVEESFRKYCKAIPQS